MKLNFRNKLTLLFFALSLTPLILSTGYFLRLYENDKLASLFESELQNTVQGATRIDSLLASARALELERVRDSRDIILMAEEPCATSEAPKNLVLARTYEKTLARLKLKPGDWLHSAGVRQACAALGDKRVQEPIILTNGPKFPLPYLYVLVPGVAVDRVLAIPMDGMGGASGSNLFFLTRPDGKILWSSGTREQTDGLDKALSKEIAKFAAQAVESGVPSVTHSGISDNIVAYAPVAGPGMVLFSVTNESLALAPVRFVLKQSILFTLGWLFLYLLVGKLAARRISKPLEELRAASESIGAGNLATRIPVVGDDEFSKVQATFNQMAEQIVKLIEDIKAKAAIEHDIAVAQKVQQWFFPSGRVKTEGHELHGLVQMAQKCGGDWWSYIEVPRAQGSPLLVLLIGDATGHGIPSALLTAVMQGSLSVLKTWIQADPARVDDPSKLLQILNQVIHQTSRGEINMSFFVAVIDNDAETMTTANAGHNKPYLIKPKAPESGFDLKAVGGIGSVLGHDPNEKYEDVASYPWKPGSQLFLYTDGLIECMKGDESVFDRRGLMQLMKKYGHLKGEQLLASIMKDRQKAIGNLPQEDDVTVVVCTRTAGALNEVKS